MAFHRWCNNEQGAISQRGQLMGRRRRHVRSYDLRRVLRRCAIKKMAYFTSSSWCRLTPAVKSDRRSNSQRYEIGRSRGVFERGGSSICFLLNQRFPNTSQPGWVVSRWAGYPQKLPHASPRENVTRKRNCVQSLLRSNSVQTSSCCRCCAFGKDGSVDSADL